ncbi:acyl carrier protein [Amycolatopsis sp. CA-230715]|uniref:acyl carrier protein n=1 Tax=Amycolatopsis sp. CA-230715 TaxID=2745196 RepID=UPI001C3407ED|nr:acyl carrier protein [Amycolatopsis sp. CA-230715]QWF78771.1 Acyl carrier protein [Amycolatopsis sp. CA-230715]
MTLALTERMDRIREIVAEHLELEVADLDDDSNFIDVYSADSLALMDVLAALEREWGIEIDQSQFARIVDVRSAYEVVAESASW